MSSSALPSPARPLRTSAVLADLIPGAKTRDLLLVAAGAVVMAACSQLAVPVPGSPVPVTLQTLGLVVLSATLGPLRGLAAQSLFLLVGAVGVPVYSDASGGLQHLTGATGGYLIGFLPAAYLVGLAARRGADRRPVQALLLAVAGQAVVFACGLPWLAVVAELSAAETLAKGFYPFIFGGLVKAVAAGLLLPGSWRLVRRIDSGR